MSKDRKLPQPSVLLSVLALTVGLAACDQPSMTGPVPPDKLSAPVVSWTEATV